MDLRAITKNIRLVHAADSPVLSDAFADMSAGRLVSQGGYKLMDLVQSPHIEIRSLMAFHFNWEQDPVSVHHVVVINPQFPDTDGEAEKLITTLEMVIDKELPKGYQPRETDYDRLQTGPRTAAVFLVYADPEGIGSVLVRHAALGVKPALRLFQKQLDIWRAELRSSS